MTYQVQIGATQLTKLTKFEVQPAKLWKDADRNMSGDLQSTYIGTFPKLMLEFGYLSELELKVVLILLQPASFNVSYWESRTGTYKTGVYYAGDFSYPLFDKEKGLYAPWGVNLIPYKKITY